MSQHVSPAFPPSEADNLIPTEPNTPSPSAHYVPPSQSPTELNTPSPPPSAHYVPPSQSASLTPTELNTPSPSPSAHYVPPSQSASLTPTELNTPSPPPSAHHVPPSQSTNPAPTEPNIPPRQHSDDRRGRKSYPFSHFPTIDPTLVQNTLDPRAYDPDAASPRVIWRARIYTKFPNDFVQETCVWDQELDTCFFELGGKRHIACRIFFSPTTDAVVVENMSNDVPIVISQDHHPMRRDLFNRQPLEVSAKTFVLHVLHDSKIAVAIAFAILPRPFMTTVTRLPIRAALESLVFDKHSAKRPQGDAFERPTKRGRLANGSSVESQRLQSAGPPTTFVTNKHHSHALSEECCYTLTRVKSFRPDDSVCVSKHSGLASQLVVVKNYDSSWPYPRLGSMRWLNEYRAYRALGHPIFKPFLLKVLGVDARVLNLYLEHIDVRDLSTTCDLTFMFSPKVPGLHHRILSDVASALTFAHGRGVVHNDLKPGNILFDPRRGAIVYDWEFATISSNYTDPPNPSGRIPGVISPYLCGTPWYLPPEIAADDGAGSSRDIFALGVIALWLLRQIPLPDSLAQYSFEIGRLGCGGDDARIRSEWQHHLLKIVESMDNVGVHGTLAKQMLEHSPGLRPSASEVKEQLQRFGVPQILGPHYHA